MGKKRQKRTEKKQEIKKVESPLKKQEKIVWNRIDSWLMVILFLLILIFLRETLLPSRTLFGTDTFSQSSIFTRFAYEVFWKTFKFPKWNPYIFSGMPFLASFSHAVSPFDIVFEPIFKLIPIEWPSSTYLIVHLFLGGLFIYILSKEYGLPWYGAYTSTLLFAFSNFYISRIFPGHGGKICVGMFIPLGVFLLERAIKSGKVLYFLWFGVVVGIQYLSKHPQILFYSLFTYFLLFLYMLIPIFKEKSKKAILKLSLLLGLALILGGMLSANQLLPNWEFKKYTHRGEGLKKSDPIKWNFATSWSLPPEELIGLFIRNPFGWEVDRGESSAIKHEIYYRGRMNLRQALEYLGILPIFMSILAILIGWNSITRFYLFLFITTLILALGKYTPIYVLVYYLIPGFSMFRVPLEIFSITAFAFAILAGIGISAFFREHSEMERVRIKKLLRVATGFILFSFVIISFLYLDREEMLKNLGNNNFIRNLLQQKTDDLPLRYLHLLKGFLIFIILSLISIGIIWIKEMVLKVNYNTIFILLCLIFMLTDIWTLNDDFVIAVPKQDLENYYQPHNAIPFLLNDNSLYRVFSSRVELYPNEYMLHKIQSISGYHAAPMASYYKFLMKFNFLTRATDFLNVKYLILPKDRKYTFPMLEEEDGLLKRFRLVMEKSFFVYQNLTCLPRAFVVHRAGKVDDLDTALAYLTHPGFDPSYMAIFTDEPPIPLRLPPEETIPSLNSSVEITEYQNDSISLRAKMDGNGIVVFSEIWYPGWKAFANRQKIPILKVNGLFRGLYLSKGEYEIKLIFDPLIQKIGNWISLVGVFIVISLDRMCRRFNW